VAASKPPAEPAEAAAEEFFEIEEPAASEAQGAGTAEVPAEALATPEQTPAATEPVASETGEETLLFEDELQATPAEATLSAAVEAEHKAEAEPAPEPEIAEAAAEAAPPVAVTEPADEFEFELVPAGGDSEEPAAAAPKSPMTSDQFLSELSAELGTDSEPAHPRAPVSPAPHAPASTDTHAVSVPPAYQVPPHVPAAAPISALGSTVPLEAGAQAAHQPGAAATATETLEAGANLNELEEVFQEFRTELGEMSDEDEDLETHYNLGIAYREMGLLDEAIGEFQKVAKAIQRGKPFRYAMQCSTLLGLTFIDKGEPQIAALWYSRALETPGIDQETVLALRYDLGLAQEQAGDSPAALNSFRQVYAVNIDYRDVAERIATLQKR